MFKSIKVLVILFAFLLSTAQVFAYDINSAPPDPDANYYEELYELDPPYDSGLYCDLINSDPQSFIQQIRETGRELLAELRQLISEYQSIVAEINSNVDTGTDHCDSTYIRLEELYMGIMDLMARIVAEQERLHEYLMTCRNAPDWGHPNTYNEIENFYEQGYTEGGTSSTTGGLTSRIDFLALQVRPNFNNIVNACLNAIGDPVIRMNHEIEEESNLYEDPVVSRDHAQESDDYSNYIMH